MQSGDLTRVVAQLWPTEQGATVWMPQAVELDLGHQGGLAAQKG